MTPGFDHNDVGYQWMADRINGHLVLGYRWFEPDNLFRRKSVYVSHARSYNFDGRCTNNFVWFDSNFEFLNYYGFEIGGNYTFPIYSPTLTRGGPLTLYPGEYDIWISGYSDSREKLIVNAHGLYAKDKLGGVNYGAGFNLEWKPNSQISLSFGPEFSRNDNPIQWVDNFDDPAAINTYNTRYVFGRILQKTLSANIRLNWTFTPTLSLQVFLQPLLAVGDYNEFKELAMPGTSSFNVYGNGESTILYDAENDEYSVDPDGNGPAESFTFENPNFNFKSLRGNIVLRWEIMPGSIFYLVWSHDQTNNDNAGSFNLTRDFRSLLRSEGNDVFLAKFSYWLNL
jgi:hypothetical protein